MALAAARFAAIGAAGNISGCYRSQAARSSAEQLAQCRSFYSSWDAARRSWAAVASPHHSYRHAHQCHRGAAHHSSHMSWYACSSSSFARQLRASCRCWCHLLRMIRQCDASTRGGSASLQSAVGGPARYQCHPKSATIDHYSYCLACSLGKVTRQPSYQPPAALDRSTTSVSCHSTRAYRCWSYHSCAS